MRAVLILGLLLGCKGAPANDPEAVADRFVDYYFVEIDQNRALGLTTGRARDTLRQEIEDTRSIRATGYTADKARGKTYYERRSSRIVGEKARLVYDIRIEQEGSQLERHVMISAGKDPQGKWKVTSFWIRDGAAPRAPPRPEP